MKGVWKWILLGVAVFLVAFFIALPLFGGGVMMPLRYHGFWMMGPRMMGGFGGFGVLGSLLGLAIPLLLVVGVVALAVSLLRRPAAPPPAPTTPCANCGRPLEQGWVACPFCGKKVK